MNFNDLLGVGKLAESLKEPIVKLIEVCAKGIGILYQPTHVRRMANAHLEEVKLMYGGLVERPGIPMKYENENIVIDATSSQELIARQELILRAQNRISYQEEQKQRNIESVITHAYADLEGEETVSKESVDNDWIIRFFDFASGISNEEMQILWGKILSGEIKEPGSFSFRTLDILRNLSNDEARAFSEMANYVLVGRNQFFIFDDSYARSSKSISFSDILILDEAGLIMRGSLSFKFTVNVNKVQESLQYGDNVILAKNNSINKVPIPVELPCYTLTKAGRDIYSIVKKDFREDYMKNLAAYLRMQNVTMMLSKRLSSKTDEVTYDCENILEF